MSAGMLIMKQRPERMTVRGIPGGWVFLCVFFILEFPYVGDFGRCLWW